MSLEALIAGLFSGLLASMGLGGGSVLVIYLVLFRNCAQLEAGGTNLLFFIPIALLSVVVYSLKNQIRYKRIAFIIIGGIAGCIAGIYFSPLFSNGVIKKAFGIFICFLGVKEIVNTVKLYLKKR